MPALLSVPGIPLESHASCADMAPGGCSAALSGLSQDREASPVAKPGQPVPGSLCYSAGWDVTCKLSGNGKDVGTVCL